MIDTADVVLHLPTKERWIVAYVEDGRLSWCGWPSGTVPVEDCKLITKADDVSRLELLKKMAEMSNEDPRRSYAMKRLGLRAAAKSNLAALDAQFREKAKAVADGLKRIESIVEHGLKREIESPSNHQEFAREAGEKLRQFRKDLKDAEAVLALHAEIVEKRKCGQ